MIKLKCWRDTLVGKRTTKFWPSDAIVPLPWAPCQLWRPCSCRNRLQTPEAASAVVSRLHAPRMQRRWRQSDHVTAGCVSPTSHTHTRAPVRARIQPAQKPWNWSSCSLCASQCKFWTDYWSPADLSCVCADRARWWTRCRTRRTAWTWWWMWTASPLMTTEMWGTSKYHYYAFKMF